MNKSIKSTLSHYHDSHTFLDKKNERIYMIWRINTIKLIMPFNAYLNEFKVYILSPLNPIPKHFIKNNIFPVN